MKPAIIKQLNRIRLLEQKKILDQFQDLLNANKKTGRLNIPDELRKNLTILFEKSFDDNDFETAIANYSKLRSLLLLMLDKDKQIKSEPDRKLKSYLPEQLELKPLVPFHFIHKDAGIKTGMVSVIVLNDNGAGHLKNLFDSFIKFNSSDNYQFILVDRDSTDDSLEIAGSYKDKLHLEIVSHDNKYTASYLNNLAVDACRSEFLLFLNVKAVFQSDILPQFIDQLSKDNSYGIIGASVYKPGADDSSEKNVQSGSIIFKISEAAGTPDIPSPLFDPEFLASSGIETSIQAYRGVDRTFIPPGFFLPCLKPFPVSLKKEPGAKIVPAVPGQAMFCKRSDFIRAGGFDLNYFNSYESIDLCLEFAKRLYKKTVFTHDIEIQLNVDDISAELSPDAKFTGYNLGTLLNRHGYYIKNKYFNDLILCTQIWTDDTIRKIGKSRRLINSLDQGSPEGPVDLKDEELVKKITTGYVEGIRNNKLRIAIKIPAFNDQRASLWGDYHFAHSLKNAFVKKGHPARVDLFDSWYEQGYMTDDVVIVLRGIKRYHTRGSQINIMWNISHPEKIDPDEYHDYDHVFVASNIFAQELQEKYSIKAENLLQCTDPALFFPDTTQIEDNMKTDILYVANSRGVMRKSVEYTMQKGIPVTIYGTNWENILPPGMIRGNYILNEELRKYYSNCNILLNDHWADMTEEGYISNRIFDALACGAIVLTDRVKGIEQTFREGLFYYNNADDLAEQTGWIREHMQEAKQMALKNSKKVLENHTFDIRAERILEVALQIHHQKTIFTEPEVIKRPNVWRRLFDFNRINPLK